jgi:hypothetical protein
MNKIFSICLLKTFSPPPSKVGGRGGGIEAFNQQPQTELMPLAPPNMLRYSGGLTKCRHNNCEKENRMSNRNFSGSIVT